MLVKFQDDFVLLDGLLVNLNDDDAAPSITKHKNIYRIEDVYANVKSDERIIFITRHADRVSYDTTITGDLTNTGINQCIRLGQALHNPNINLSNTYIGGSHKYRAKNTAYQVTKAMGVVYPDQYNYLTDTDAFDLLMEINFFVDDDGDSKGISLDRNAYYSFVDDTIYNGTNKVDDHVTTKSKELFDFLINTAANHNADLCWFGTHDKVILPLLAYVTDRTQPLHIERDNSDVYIKMTNPITKAETGKWSIPLLSGIAVVVNKTSGAVDMYPVESTPFIT